MSLPFAIVDADAERPVLLGLSGEGLVGFDPESLDTWMFEPYDITSVISTDPACVFYGARAAWSEMVHGRAAANRAKKRLPKFVAKGHDFPVLPDGVLSGFPVAARTIRKLRGEVPSVDTITVSALFAVSTVRTSIEQAEMSYDCFGKLYNARSRTMPPVADLRQCFRGLQNTKSRMFSGVAGYASEIRQAIVAGYQDRELRSVLALDTDLPDGLGLAKLSFTLALLGHDTICLDGRLLGTMFSRAQRTAFEGAIGKERGRISTRALQTYEAAEDAFLSGNPHFDPNDPIGRARAQWTSWEAVGGKGASHSVWLKMLVHD